MADAPARLSRRDVLLSAMAAPFYWLGFGLVAVKAAWRWGRESFLIGRETARKRWPHAG